VPVQLIRRMVIVFLAIAVAGILNYRFAVPTNAPEPPTGPWSRPHPTG